MIAVNTDSHSQLELANIALGISVARRGWLSAANVINTRDTEDLLLLLQEKRQQKTGPFSLARPV